MKKIFIILSISLMMLVSSFPYNFISNQDNTIYSEGTTPSANKLQNGSFEDGPFFSGSYSQPSQADVPHWNTTAYEGKIELLKSNNNVYISGVTLTPTEGTYAAELNADEESTLYQIVSTTPSSIYEWGLDHGSRNGTDTMALVIGPAQSVNPSKPSKDGRDQFMQMTDWLAGKGITSVKTSGSGHSDVITCYSKKFGTEGTFLDNADNNAFSLTPTTQHTEEWKIWIIYDSKVTTGTNPWGKYGSNDPVNASTNGTVDLDKYNLYNVPVGQTSTIFAFVSVGFHDGGGKTFGNFLDNINFKIYHRLTGSTSTNGNGLVVKSSDNSSHSIYVTDELLTYVDDNENLTLTAIIKKEDFDEGCEFAGMYYTTIGSNGNEVITFINTGSDNVVDSSYTGSTDGKWVRTINTNGDVEYKYALNGIKASTDIHFVFIKSPTITYDSNGGKPYVVDRIYNTDEPENVYSFKPSTGAENITFIEPYTSKAAEGLYNDWKFTGWKLTGDILSITSSGITIVNADRLNSYILPAEHTVVCDYSFNGVLNNKSHQYFKIYKSKPAFTKNEVITDGTLKGVNWNTDNSDLAYANVNTGLTMVAQWRWRQTFTPQYLSEGSYVNSITGGTVRVTSVGSDNENYNSNFTSEGAVAYFAEANEQITAEATANTNYKFVGWFDEKGNLISTNKTYTYTVNAQDTKKYYARFVLSTSTDTYTTYKVEHYIVDGSTTSLYTSVDKVGFMGTKVTAEPIAISGYSYNSSHSENIIEKVIPTTGTLTLKLYYGKTYTNTLKYDFNGGHSSSITNQTVSVTYPNTKSKFTVTTTKPLKTGYSFDGWYTEQEGGTKVVDSTYEVGINGFAGNQEATLYAHWIPNTYTNTVVYNLNGGILNIENSINTTNNVTYPNTASDHAVTDEVPSKTGYSFIGWYTAIDGGDKKEASNTYTFGQNNYQGNQITKLYAHWAPINYINTLKYNLNGGTSTATINDQSKTVTFPNTESTFALTDIVPTKTGYTFDGWHDASDVKHTTSYAVGQPNYAGNQEATLNAKWIRDQYTITYSLDGGTVSFNPNVYYVDSSEIVLNNPLKTGYTFKGWIGSNGETAQTTVKIPTGSTGNKEYTALWQANTDTAYIVNHWKQNIEGGSEQNAANFTCVETESLAGTTGVSVTPSVKSYTGFIAPSTKTVTIAADGSTVVDYYYTRNQYTVTLNGDDGIQSLSGSGTYRYGKQVNISSTLKSGYEWVNWTGDKNSSDNLYNFNMPAQNLTISAHSNLITYTITYNLDGGSVSSNPEAYNVITPTFSLTNPTKAGYVFLGWVGSNGSTEQTSVSIPLGSTGNKEYAAKWALSLDTKYTVKHWQQNIGGGSEQNTTNFTLKDTEELRGTTGITLYPETKTYEGFTSPARESLTILADGTAELNYYYTRNKYKVETIPGAGISSTTGNGIYWYGQQVTINATVSDGYDWSNWNNSEAAQEYRFNMPDHDVSYTAYATLHNYTISYDLDGGTVNTENPTSYNISSDNIVLNNPTRQGYDFAGWTGSNGTVPQITASVPSGSTGDKNFKANWTPRNDTTYKVQHWKQTLTGGDVENDTNYELVTADTENLTGTTGASVTPAVKSYTGFASPSTKTVTILADGSTVVNYYYKRNSYTVTLNKDTGVSDVSGAGTYKYGSTVNVSAITDSGYYFAGWTGDFSSSEFVMPAHDVTMTANSTTGQTAKYTVYHYEIDADDNPTTIELAKDVLYGDVGSRVTAVPKDIPGYTFADSYQPNIKTGNVEASGSLVLKLYYHTDTLTYYANGGHLANDSSIDQITDTGHIGQQLTVRNSGTFVKDGYTFIGWNTMPDVTGVTYNPGSSYALTSNEDKLYAVWVRNISLIYDANAPAGTTVQGNTDPDYSYAGSTVTVKNNGFVIDGYYFIKWNTKSDGTGVDYINPNDYCLSDYTSENVNSNVLYAQWGRLNTYKVKHTLLKSNEEVFTTYETDYYGRNGQIVNATSNNYEGYYLEGLSTMSGTVDDQNSLVLEFKYKPKNNIPYKVFHYLVDRNGNISLEEQIISTGYTNDVVQAVSKTISNYAFDDSYSGTILSDSIRADGTTELKLYYIENKYSLTFKANYGTEADQVRYDYGDQSVSVLPALTRSGYAFAGWNTMMDGGGTTYMPGDNYALQYTDGVLYAQWVPVIVPVSTTLIYKPNGGNGTDQVYNGYVDDNVSVIDNPFDRNGYTFTGWNTRVDGSGTAYGAGDNYTLIDGDNVLYAQWKKNRPNHSTYTGEIPLTADESNIAVWIGICITSFIAMIGMILIKRQSKRH